MPLVISNLDEETPGRSCSCCSADLSWLPDEAVYCCFCGFLIEDQYDTPIQRMLEKMKRKNEIT